MDHIILFLNDKQKDLLFEYKGLHMSLYVEKVFPQRKIIIIYI